MKYVVAFGRFWWDFLVGDTPEIAIGAPAVLWLAWTLHTHRDLAVVLMPLAVIALLGYSVRRGMAGK